MSIKQKRPNYGISEFVLSAYDYDGNVVGRFVEQSAGSLPLRHHTCPNGASVGRSRERWDLLFTVGICLDCLC